ncbi:MAG: RidA family protein [Opitutaceae bacterium]
MKTVLAPFAGSPPAGGPYSLAVRAAGPLLFVAGQGPWDPATGRMERGPIAEQTRLTLDNIARIVAKAGGKMENAVSVRVYLQPMTPESFAEMNSAYARYWGPDKPVRTTVGAQLDGLDVEIDCVIALD